MPLDFSQPRYRTVELFVFDQLRRAILDGTLQPGEWLRQDDMAERLQVSRMPVREALRVLATEGLVTLVPHRGAVVTDLSVEDLEEIYAARCGLEALAARIGAERVTDGVLAEMHRYYEELDALAWNDLGGYLKAERQFHAVCYQASGRERLIKIVDDLRERAERYIRLAHSSPGRLPESLAFQRAFLEACERRNGRDAEQIIQEALRWTVRHVTQQYAAGFRHDGNRQGVAHAPTG
ncbi:MAG: GntR family transcriptional regulator [Chloroflexi bacterium]|nr:GntR family transcriptional regulator [Chloroflexota bacterium]